MPAGERSFVIDTGDRSERAREKGKRKEEEIKREKEGEKGRKVRFTVTSRIVLFPSLFESQLVITSHGLA